MTWAKHQLTLKEIEDEIQFNKTFKKAQEELIENIKKKETADTIDVHILRREHDKML